MKVRLKKTHSSDYPDISPGAPYLVIENLADGYRILNENHRPFVFKKEAFQVLDRHASPFWVSVKYPDGEIDRVPRPFREPGFFEAFFDGDPKTVKTFWIVYKKMTKTDKSQSYLRRQRV